MLIDLFKEYLLLSSQLRSNYATSLGDKEENWESIVSLIEPNIPQLYQVIYNNVSGTRRDIKKQELMDFIPGYRLIHINELIDEKNTLEKMLTKYANVDKKTIIPLLANYSSDFICYMRNKNNEESIVGIFHDYCELVVMHKSVERFLETICEFYRKKVYYLDDDLYLDYDISMEGQIGTELNDGVNYWSE